MSDLVNYELEGGVAVVTMDDGKANALSPAMLAAIDGALDRAEKDGAAVVLAGRPGRFSGGFDLNVIRQGDSETVDMLRGGFELTEHMLRFPRPLVMACTGHAVAMASFVLLAGDYRVGADGEFKIVANEVAIGLTMPYAAIELCRYRLTPSAFDRTQVLATPYTPADAVTAGFLDEVVDPDAVVSRARELATAFTALDATAHTGTKLRVRAGVLDALRTAIDAEFPR
jgi:enoyl-CoA hydratase